MKKYFVMFFNGERPVTLTIAQDMESAEIMTYNSVMAAKKGAKAFLEKKGVDWPVYIFIVPDQHDHGMKVRHVG
ncbi:MAG TPA: hypothetical protein VHD33_03975 [Legionellaceae bacterium]|nr:hypothetical protein [Legionellaceae bacterium]